MLSQSKSDWLIFVLNLTLFASSLSYFYFLPVWIWIHKVAEYGSNLYPDTHHWSREYNSTKFFSTGSS